MLFTDKMAENTNFIRIMSQFKHNEVDKFTKSLLELIHKN